MRASANRASVNPRVQSIEIDSKPDFLFTATGGPEYGATIKTAQDTNRQIVITYTQPEPAWAISWA